MSIRDRIKQHVVEKAKGPPPSDKQKKLFAKLYHDAPCPDTMKEVSDAIDDWMKRHQK